MGNKALKYGFVAIGLYIVVARATGAGRFVSESTRGAANLVRAFQGR